MTSVGTLLWLAAELSLAAPPTASELLAKYDAVMGPENFEAVMRMTANREDGTARTYKMRIVKSGSDKMRMWFDEPASVRGQEILRIGENMWVYMPNLKRAVRVASRDSFQGGDFNNADVLRVNYEADYVAEVAATSSLPDTWELHLKAKNEEASYDQITLWLGTKDGMPVKGEYYTESGKLLRAAELSDVKGFTGIKRPSRVLMRNALSPKRSSELAVDSMSIKVKPSPSLFVLDNLGR